MKQWRVASEGSWKIGEIPAIEFAEATSDLPLMGFFSRVSVQFEGEPLPAVGQVPLVPLRRVSPGYFRAMGIPLSSGRGLTDFDNGHVPVAIVNQSFAQTYHPESSVLGKLVYLGRPTPTEFQQDIRYALRTLRKSPVFTAVAVGSLALGIGANTAIFSLLDTVILRQLPVQHPEELVELLQKYPNQPRQNGFWSRQSFEHFRDNNQVFSVLTHTIIDTQVKVRANGSEQETVIGEYIPGNYFPVLGLKPALGGLIGSDDNPTNAAVAVVSWSYWKSRFHLDPAVVASKSSCRVNRQRL